MRRGEDERNALLLRPMDLERMGVERGQNGVEDAVAFCPAKHRHFLSDSHFAAKSGPPRPGCIKVPLVWALTHIYGLALYA